MTSIGFAQLRALTVAVHALAARLSLLKTYELFSSLGQWHDDLQVGRSCGRFYKGLSQKLRATAMRKGVLRTSLKAVVKDVGTYPAFA
jgi:hypothetical protein